MASNSGQIRFGVGFDVDQSSLSKIKASLKELMNMKASDLKILDADKAKTEVEKIKQSAAQLQSALQKSFNQDLGTLNITKFNQELKKLDLKSIQNNLASAGTVGKTAFKNIATQALTTNMQLKQTNNILDKMGTTMMNTVKWGITSSIMNTFTGAVQEAFGYVKALDSSLTNIRIVTGQSMNEMKSFAVAANEAAAALGRQTKEYTNAALTFYQQGLDEKEVTARTEAVLKASNITGESSEKMAEYLTSVWNGFQVSMEESENVVSKLAAVADSSASNMAELATGMSYVASTANSLGVNVDQLSAQIATIIATTRQAPQAVGNALKTVYARIADIKAGADDAEISLGNYSGKMADLGINVLDAGGNLRDLGDVFEEIGSKWGNFNREQQITLAQIMGGQRQYNQMISLFDNWTKYSDMLNVSLNSQGAIDEKNAVYMDSLAAHMNQLSAARENLMDSLIDSDSWKGFIDGATEALNILSKFIDGIGGGGTAILAFGSSLTQVFSKQIGNEIGNIAINLQNAFSNKVLQNAQSEMASRFANLEVESAEYKEIISLVQQRIELGSALTSEEQAEVNELIQATNELQNQKIAWEENKEEVENYINLLKQNKIDEPAFQDFSGKLNFMDLDSEAIDDLKSLDSALEQQRVHLEEVSSVMREYRDTTINAAEAMKTSHQTNDEDIRRIKIGIRSMFDEIRNGSDLPQEKLDELWKKIVEFRQSISTDDAPQVISGKAKGLIEILERTVNEEKINVDKAREILRQGLEGIEQNLSEKTSSLKNRLADLFSGGNLRSLATGFTQIASSAGQFGSVLMSVTNAVKTFNSETATGDEKLQAIISVVSMAIPMAISGISGLVKGVKSLASAFTAAKIAAFPWLTIIGGIIAGITAVVTAGVKYWNRYADALKEAKKQEESLKEVTQKLKTEINELQSAVDKYKNNKQAIKDLVAGTQEWKEATAATKQELIDLIAKYPELIKAVDQTSKGFELNEEKYSEFLKQQQEHLNDAQIAQLNASIKTQQASIDASSMDVAHDLWLSKDQIDKLIVAVETNGKEILFNSDQLEKEINVSQSQAESIVKNNEKVLELVGAVDANKEAIYLLNSTILDSRLIGNETYDESKYQPEHQIELDRHINDYIEKRRKVDEQTGAVVWDLEGRNLVEEYQKLHPEYKDFRAGILSDFVYEDENDEKQRLDLETVILEILSKEAEQEYLINKEIEKREKIFNQIYSPFEKAGVSEALRGDFSNLSREKRSEFTGMLNNLDEDTLLSIAQQHGYDTGKEYKKALSKSLAEDFDAQTELINQAEELGSKTLVGFLQGLRKEGASTKEMDSISDAFQSGMERGISDVNIENIFKKIPEKDRLNFAEIFSSDIANLGNEDSFKQLADDLREAGISVNFFDESWQKALKDSGAYEQFLNNLSERTESLNNVITKTASGDKLNKKELEEYNNDIGFIIDSLGDFDQLTQGVKTDIKIITDEYLQGTQTWIDALKRVREESEMATASLRYQDLQDAFDAIPKIEKAIRSGGGHEVEIVADLNSEQFEEEMQNLLDRDYELEVSVNEDIESDLKDMGDLRDQIEVLKGLDASQTKFAFSDIKSVFTDLKEAADGAYTILESGEVQFSDTVIKEALRRKENQLAMAKETTKGEIEEQNKRIQAKINELKADLQIGQEYEAALQAQYDAETNGTAEQAAAAKKVADDKKKAYDEEISNTDAKLKAIDEEAGLEAEAVSQSAGIQIDAMTEVASASDSVIEAAATEAEKVSASIKAEAESVIKNYNAMAAAKANYASDNPDPNFMPSIANAATGTRGTVEKPSAYNKEEKAYQSTYSKVEAEFSTDAQKELADSNATLKELLSVQNHNSSVADAIARYEEVLVGNTQEQVDLLTDNYANNAGERPKADKGSKGGGGKGGSSPKEKEAKAEEPKTMDLMDTKDLDTFENKTKALDDTITHIGHELDKIKNLQQRYLGSALVHNLNKQLVLLNKQKKAYQQKLEMARAEQQMLQAQLGAMGAQFNEYGVLTNGTQMLQGQVQQINGMIVAYNGMTAAEQGAAAGQIQMAQANYQNTQSMMQQYQQINMMIPQLEAMLEQIAEMELEIRINKFNAVIDLHIDWQDWDDKMNEFKRDMDDLRKNYSKIFISADGSAVRGMDALEAATGVAAMRNQSNRARTQADFENRNNYNQLAKRVRGNALTADTADALNQYLTAGGINELSTYNKKTGLYDSFAIEQEKKLNAAQRKAVQQGLSDAYINIANNIGDAFVAENKNLTDMLGSVLDKNNKANVEENFKKIQEINKNAETFRNERFTKFNQDMDRKNKQERAKMAIELAGEGYDTLGAVRWSQQKVAKALGVKTSEISNKYRGYQREEEIKDRKPAERIQYANEQMTRFVMENVSKELWGSLVSNFDNKVLDTAITDDYYKDLENQEDIRKQEIKDTTKLIIDSAKEVGDETSMVAQNLISVFENKSKSAAEKIDSMLKGTRLLNGEMSTSIVDDSLKHAQELSDRMSRMALSTTYDKQGNKIMGNDALQIGDRHPTTGKIIRTKQELKQARNIMSKDKTGAVYEDYQAKMVEDGQKYIENMQSQVKALQESVNEMFEAYYEALEKSVDVVDDIIDEYDFLDGLYDRQVKYFKSMSEEKAEELGITEYISKLEKKQTSNREAQLKVLEQNALYYKQQMDAAMEAEGIYSEEWRINHDAFEKYTEKYYEMQFEYIDELKEKAEEALDDIIKKFDKAQTSGFGIDELSERWEKTKDISDMYLSNIDKAYEIQKLQSKYQEAIDKETDPRRKAQLQSVMEEQVRILRDAEHLSQAEVDNANNLYDVTVKQIALEEAQRNKSKMRLRRDSQGNYTYQFVSDTNDIQKKQQDVSDALKKLNDGTTKALEENYDEQIKLFKDFISRLREIQKEYLEGNITQAEYEERLDFANQSYQEQAKINAEQQGRFGNAYTQSNAAFMMGLSESDMNNFLDNMGLSASESVEMKNILQQLSTNGLLGLFNGSDKNILKGLQDKITGMEDNFHNLLLEKLYPNQMNDIGELIKGSDGVVQELKSQVASTKQEIDEVESNIVSQLTDGGLSLAAIEASTARNIEGMQTSVDLIKESLTGLKTSAEDYYYNYVIPRMGDLNTAIKNMNTYLASLMNEGQYGAALGKELSGNTLKKVNTVASFNTDALQGLTTIDAFTGFKSNTGQYKGTKTTNNRVTNQKAITALEEAISNTQQGKEEGFRNVYILQTQVTTDPATGDKKTYAQIQLKNANGTFSGQKYWVDLSYLRGYDTGGYTGDWSGNSGKLAILHKKEQVLNADDTQKIFDSVAIANNVTSILSSLGAAAGALTSTDSMMKFMLGNSKLDQNVSIQATFPNVSDHNEIEQALNNLINKASQYANPNRRKF